jgi:hypothetical protein
VADLEGIVERLQAISEELADAGIDALREAIAEGASTRPDRERRITQARRAVEKAITSLHAAAGANPGGTDDMVDD